MIHLHADSALASTTGVGTALYVAATDAGGIEDPQFWVKMIPAMVGPVLVVVVNRVFAMRGARKRVLAADKDLKAEELEKDSDPSNDAEARKLRRDAKVLRAEAAALDNSKDQE